MNYLTPTSLQDKLRLVESLEPNQESERFTLDQLWLIGGLQKHIVSLEKFYLSRKDDLLNLFEQNSASFRIVDLAKVLIVESVTVDQPAETIDQIKEIKSEIWVQGERGNYDRARIALDWTSHHAELWRRWRIKEYLYTAEKMENRILEFIPGRAATR